MVVDAAKFGFEDRQALEVMPDRIFIGDAIAAVDLDGFLADQARGLAHADLCRESRAASARSAASAHALQQAFQKG